jgi:hypothetical protein
MCSATDQERHREPTRRPRERSRPRPASDRVRAPRTHASAASSTREPTPTVPRTSPPPPVGSCAQCKLGTVERTVPRIERSSTGNTLLDTRPNPQPRRSGGSVARLRD